MVNYYNYSHVQPLRRMKVGASPNISPDASFSNAERISIGDRIRIGSGCRIWAGPGRGKINIGDDVLFGPDVLVTAASYRYNDGSPVTEQPMDEGDIIIGDDVWLATGAIILPGARIGDGAVIAANAVVKGQVPPMAIVAGAPAEIVSRRTIPGAELSRCRPDRHTTRSTRTSLEPRGSGPGQHGARETVSSRT